MFLQLLRATGLAFVTLPRCYPRLSRVCPGYLPTLPGCHKRLDGRLGMSLAPKGTETRVPA